MTAVVVSVSFKSVQLVVRYLIFFIFITNLHLNFAFVHTKAGHFSVIVVCAVAVFLEVLARLDEQVFFGRSRNFFSCKDGSDPEKNWPVYIYIAVRLFWWVFSTHVPCLGPEPYFKKHSTACGNCKTAFTFIRVRVRLCVCGL